MPVTRSDFVHACNVHLHAIVEKDLPLTIFGRVSGQLGFVWAVPDAVHFSICWICDFLQVSGVWWPLLCLSLYDITIILYSLLPWCGLQTAILRQISSRCNVVLWPPAYLHIVVELFLFHN